MKYLVAKSLSILGFSLSFLGISQAALAQTSITIDHTTAGGLQSYTVPSGFVRAALTARGADGGIGTGNARSGSGATATAIISIIPGNVFNSVIGEAGQGNTNDAGGGGGTGLCLGSTLIIVGGGGGGADNTDNAAGGAINGGNDINNGRDGYSRRTLQPLGGTPANIAQAGENSGTDVAAGAGGGGINGDGEDFTSSAAGGGGTATGGEQADITCATLSAGGLGVPTSSLGPGVNGGAGFGGGGGSWGRAGGGGGGYYGGGGGGNSGWTGGGGSFMAASLPAFISGSLTAGANRANIGADGFVEIIIYALPEAINNTVINADGMTGVTNIINVFSNDVIGANAVTSSNVNLTLATGSSVPPELTFDTSTGNVSLAADTPPGTYSFDYQICNVDQVDLCDIATVSITVPAIPLITASKTVTMFTSGEYSIPGNEVIYSFLVTNEGTGPVDLDSVFLVDTLPEEIEIFIGDIDDGGPETDPVSFVDAGSGLTFNYTNDVGFFDGAIKPTSFAECNFIPAAGYNSDVKHICFNPKGTFTAGTPNPSFTLNFRARIK